MTQITEIHIFCWGTWQEYGCQRIKAPVIKNIQTQQLQMQYHKSYVKVMLIFLKYKYEHFKIPIKNIAWEQCTKIINITVVSGRLFVLLHFMKILILGEKKLFSIIG